MKFTIDRSKWLRGEGPDDSYLLRNLDDRMCCLGFFGVACGIPTQELGGVRGPQRDTRNGTSWKKDISRWLFDVSDYSDSGADLMEINDSQELDGPTREAKITAIFAKHNIEVEFVG